MGLGREKPHTDPIIRNVYNHEMFGVLFDQVVEIVADFFID